MRRDIIAEYRFLPGGPFVARRHITIRGQHFQPGQDMDPDLVSVRRWRQLYETRRVACIPEDDEASRIALARARSNAEPAAPPAPEPRAQQPAAPKPDPQTATPAYQCKHTGGGRYVVLAPDGQPMTDPMPRERARSMAADLNGG